MGQIDLATAMQMVANYEGTRKSLIDQTYKLNDTKSIWFSIDEFNSFAKALPTDASGVRIYLGAYDGSYAGTPNQTTIIAIGTIADQSGDDADQIGGGLDEGTIAPEPFNSGKLCPPICSPPTQ